MNRIQLSLVMLALLSGCLKSKDGDSRTVVQGLWRTDCLSLAANSEQVEYRFTSSHQVIRRDLMFTDNACQTPLGTIMQEGTYALEVLPEISLYNIDLFFTAVVASPDSEEGAALWNQQGYCGSTDWAQRVSKNLLGRSEVECQSFGVQKIEYRDVVKVQKDQDLVFGQIYNHLLIRPQTVDRSSPDHVFTLISL